MYISKEVFLSEASWRIEPRLGFVNLVNAPMASGKTTWARNFNAEGITLLLVPTVALAKQLEAAGWKYVKMQNTNIFTKWAFGDERRPKLVLYVATVQDFCAHLPSDTSGIKTIFIDEIDWVLIDTTQWSAESRNKIDAMIAWLLRYKDEVTIIGFSATGMGLVAAKLAGACRICITNETLKELERITAPYYNAGMWLHKYSGTPVLIYTKFLKRCAILKAIAEFNGYTVGVVTGNNPNPRSYTLTNDDIELKHHLQQHQTVPEKFNCIIINDGANRGLNIKNPYIKHVLLDNNSNTRASHQAHGRLRYGGVTVWAPAPATQEMVSDWLPDELSFDAKNLDTVRLMFNFRSGRNLATWTKMKKMCMEHFNYEISEKGNMITMKRSRVLSAGFGQYSDEELIRLVKEEVEQGILPLFYVTNNPQDIDRFVGQGDLMPPNQKYGRETPLGTSTGSHDNSDAKKMDGIVDAKKNNSDSDAKKMDNNFDANLMLDTWYELAELKKLTGATTKNSIKQYCDAKNLQLVDGRPRIDGVQTRRLKLMPK